MKHIRFLVQALLLVFSCNVLLAQERIEVCLDMEQTISTAQNQSLSAMLARHNFLVSYWEYRTHKSQLLPSLTMAGNVGQYNRSLVQVQNYQTGEILYVNNNNLQNTLSMTLNQNIALTGGSLSVSTVLNRLDQFSPHRSITYNTNPVFVSYSQPLNGYNALKWRKKTEPKRFDLAKKTFVKAMEEVGCTAIELFFALLDAQNNLGLARSNSENDNIMYQQAIKRFEIGAISRDDLLQMKLKVYNDSLNVKDMELLHQMALQKFRTFMGFNETVDIALISPEQSPDVLLNLEDVFKKVQANSPDYLALQINKIAAEQAVASAKANTGLSATLHAQFGMNQVGSEIAKAYTSPLDKEIVGVSFTIPLIDWGLGAGRVKVAKSQQKVVEANAEKTVNSLREEITYKVLQFNKQGAQCGISLEAARVAEARYESAKQRFVNGTISVMELNNAQAEMNSAKQRYLRDIGNYWLYYYSLRRLTLYDYITDRPLEADTSGILRSVEADSVSNDIF